MRIAIDISPIVPNTKSEHKVRGVGKYISLLSENVEKIDKTNTYVLSSDPSHEKNIDLIHYPYFDPFFITLPYIKKVKTVVTVHDLIPIAHKQAFPAGIKGNLKWQINKTLLRQADGVLADSEASKKEIVRLVGIKKEKVHSVYLSVDHDFKKLLLTKEQKKSFEKKYRLPSDFILYVGDVTWNKNLPRLIQAVKKTNTTLVMVGKAITNTNFDPKNPWNHDRIIVSESIANDSQFRALGFVETDDLVKLYNMAQALITPSLDEGFGLPALEAMTSGCPVISSRLGSLPEVVGDAALFIDAKSVESIAHGMQKVLDSRQLQNTLSKKGLIRASEFSLEKMVQDTVNIYNSVGAI